MNWKPIETAPKTSKSILVYCPMNYNIFQVVWSEDFGWQFFGPFSTDLKEEATHWMPLPPPPEA